MTRLKYELAPAEAFEEFPEWEAKGLETLAKEGAAFISIVSSSPDLLKRLDRIFTVDAGRFEDLIPQLLHRCLFICVREYFFGPGR